MNQKLMQQIAAKEKLKELVEKFQALNKDQIRKYTEEETKKDFILPLFEILGWNVYDKKDVTAEETQSGGRVDYGFYLNGRIKFYLEAKSIKTDLNQENFANQAVRYSFNKGVTWAVLTDFETIKVFNAQDITASLFNKLYFEIKYEDYIDRFDQLWLLSKEAFENGLIDYEAEKAGKKLQKISIGEQLYKTLKECRELLTDRLGAWNKEVPRDLLDEGVQKLISRLIFIRVAEDRKIEPPTLIPLLREWETSKSKEGLHIYQSMIDKFRELDKIYNSNLFSSHPFEHWKEYSGYTEKVINLLYGKAGYYEYDFSAIPADILGHVYENYLGYKLEQSKKGLSIHKDAVKRKEKGIYYTPSYIVDYIVENALNPVLTKCTSISDLQKIRILDPACGSGSFLVKALEVMYKKYIEFGNPGGMLTKLMILQQNIYGVDLDDQAVELARLNLLLITLDDKMKLPLLDKNIKCGNSLISGTDNELEKYFGTNFRDKKPFNWEEEFPEVFEQGGFDVIIGNPPYIFARGGNFGEDEKKYYYDQYKLQQYQLNTYLLFIERAYQLLKKEGTFGFIIPNNWLTINTFSKFREFILKEVGNIKVINAIDTIFSQASVDTCILIFEKIKSSKIQLGELVDGHITTLTTYSQKEFYKNDFLINIKRSSNKLSSSILEKINKGTPLGGTDVAKVKSGLVAYEVGKGNPPQTKEMKDDRAYHSKTSKDHNWLKYLDGVDVDRYLLNWSGEYIKYGKNLAAPRNLNLFFGPRILVRQIPSKPPYCINAVYVEKEFINDRNSNNVLPVKGGLDLKFILGVINSRLISYWFIHTFNKFQRKIFPQFKVNELAKFPIHPASKDQQRIITKLVNEMLELKNNLRKIDENSNKWNSIKSEIERTDKKIDEEVCKLYGLTREEISVVENKT